MKRSMNNKTEKMMADHICSLAEMAFRSELNKDKSLKYNAGQLLVCITILSVAFLTPVQSLGQLSAVDLGSLHWQRIFYVSYIAILAPLFIALVLVLLSLSLQKNVLLDSPAAQYLYFEGVFRKECENNQEISYIELSRSYCDALENEFQALASKHNRMGRLLRAGTAFVIASCALAAICTLQLFFMIL